MDRDERSAGLTFKDLFPELHPPGLDVIVQMVMVKKVVMALAHRFTDHVPAKLDHVHDLQGAWLLILIPIQRILRQGRILSHHGINECLFVRSDWPFSVLTSIWIARTKGTILNALDDQRSYSSSRDLVHIFDRP